MIKTQVVENGTLLTVYDPRQGFYVWRTLNEFENGSDPNFSQNFRRKWYPVWKRTFKLEKLRYATSPQKSTP